MIFVQLQLSLDYSGSRRSAKPNQVGPKLLFVLVFCCCFWFCFCCVISVGFHFVGVCLPSKKEKLHFYDGEANEIRNKRISSNCSGHISRGAFQTLGRYTHSFYRNFRILSFNLNHAFKNNGDQNSPLACMCLDC